MTPHPLPGVYLYKAVRFSRRTACTRALLASSRSSDVGETLVHYYCHPARISTLNSRGWTLQESVSSPRIVSIIDSGMKWHCGIGTFWESGIEYEEGDTMHGNPLSLKLGYTGKADRVWWTWMENYSMRRLTFAADKLPAVFGLIHYYQRITNDIPLLGLWKSSLDEDLAWKREGTRSDHLPEPLADYNLPSWSPFSCDQIIRFPFDSLRAKRDDPLDCCIDIIDIGLSWQETPYLSKIRSSYLVVEGSLQELYLSEASDIPDCNPPYFNVDHEEVELPIDLLPWRCAVQWDQEGFRPPGTWLCLLLHR